MIDYDAIEAEVDDLCKQVVADAAKRGHVSDQRRAMIRADMIARIDFDAPKYRLKAVETPLV